MEELQDAIEDAQYVNAIATQEEGPRPVLPWEKPNEEQLAAWESSKRPNLGTLDWTLSSPIGLFLFSSFLKEKHDDYMRINFCEEVQRFKRLQGRPRYDKALEILHNYLMPIEEMRHGTTTMTATTTTESANGEREQQQQQQAGEDAVTTFTPQRTEIDEYDLLREVPKQQFTKEEIDKLMALNMDYPLCTATVLGLKGPVWKELTLKFNQLKEMIKMGPRISSVRDVRLLPSSNSSGTRGGPGGGLMRLSTPPALQVELAAKQAAEQDEGSKLTTASSAASAGGAVDTDDDDEVISSTFSSKSNTAAAAKDNETSAQAVAATDDQQPVRGVKKSLSSEESPTPPMQGMASKWLRSSAHEPYVSVTIFDQAERVVIESLRRQYWHLFLESEEYVKFKNFMWYQDRRVVPDDFFVMRVLGRGGFGLVTACKKGTSGKLYAMKVMNKRRIKMKKSEQLALNERQALAAVESNFVVNLKYSFHSKDDVFLILDLMTGGDLGYHLHQKGRFPKKECQYYAARIMLGLQALHDKGYVYRDLKPENCLLADDGRVRITDLGLATKITPTLHGAAGTRGYWAPEMLRRDPKGKRMPYGHTVDWFSFGCCVAEFISGSNPFRSEVALNFGLERGKQTKEKAIDCATLEMDPVFKPEKFEPDAADLCRRLLDKNEKTRLGFTGCEAIMAHPWFKNVNWEAIISDRKRPPFIPPKDVNAASQSEIGTFAEDKAYQETVITASDEEVYKDWDWTNPHAFASEVIEFLIYERETGEPLVPINQHGSCCCAIL